MKPEQKEFFVLLDEFRKLNMGSMLPVVSHGDACILKSINTVQEYKSEGEGSVRVADIVEEMHAPAPAVSRGLRSLEERGLIRRNVDEKDRRNTFVELTKEGERLSLEIEEIMAEFADAVFQRVGTDSFAQLNQGMRTLVDASREELEKRKYKKIEKGAKEV